MSPPRARRGRHTRDDLVGLALDLVAREGLRALTMTRLAEEAGLTTPALYRYFAGGREELLLEVVRRGASRLTTSVWAGAPRSPDPDVQLRWGAERKRALMDAFGPTMMRSVYAGMLEADDELTGELDLSWKESEAFIRRVIAEGARHDLVRTDLDLEAAVQLWLAVGIGIDIIYALGRSSIPIESVYEAFHDSMLGHLRAPESQPGD